MSSSLITLIVVVLVGIGVVALNVIMRRRGYSIPGKTAVRCSQGHLFVTTWIEGGSLKAVRLSPFTRFQYCPIGKHWAIVHPIKDEDLSDKDRRQLSGRQ